MKIDTPLKEIYPDLEESEYGMLYDYDSIVNTFGFKIIVEVSDNDYQGDSRLLLHNSDTHEYGLLIFGWGSCSGCDWLQGCNTFEELEELRMHLYNNIVWKSNADVMAQYLEEHDWEASFLSQPENKEFVDKALDILRNGA